MTTSETTPSQPTGPTLTKAIVKFNRGRGALLCNKCNWIVKADFPINSIEDKEFYCEEFGFKCRSEEYRAV